MHETGLIRIISKAMSQNHDSLFLKVLKVRRILPSSDDVTKQMKIAFASYHSFSDPKRLHAEMVPPLKEDIDKNLSTAFAADIASRMSMKENMRDSIQVSFSHVQLYVDHVHDLVVYKRLEDSLNKFSEAFNDAETTSRMDFKDKQAMWQTILGDGERTTSFEPQNRDIIKQLISGLGFRVTGSRFSSQGCETNSRSLLVTTADPNGVQFVITAIDEHSKVETDTFHHFDARKSLCPENTGCLD